VCNIYIKVWLGNLIFCFYKKKTYRTKQFFYEHEAAVQNEVHAEVVVAYFYVYGGIGGVVQNYTKGMYWWKKVAEQGNSDATQVQLADAALAKMYFFGDGATENLKKALYYAQKAATKGGNIGVKAQILVVHIEQLVKFGDSKCYGTGKLLDGSPYANKGRCFTMAYSTVYQIVGKHRALMKSLGRYYLASFGSADVPGEHYEITGYAQ
jgi:TPR repeat protein